MFVFYLGSVFNFLIVATGTAVKLGTPLRCVALMIVRIFTLCFSYFMWLQDSFDDIQYSTQPYKERSTLSRTGAKCFHRYPCSLSRLKVGVGATNVDEATLCGAPGKTLL